MGVGEKKVCWSREMFSGRMKMGTPQYFYGDLLELNV